MESAEGDELIILLHIAEGSNFDLKNEDIVLVASLGGNKLETEPVASGAQAIFNNNLIWETEKKSIKRMKTENLPIKLECFTSNMCQGQELRNLIGYVLLPIRGIAVTSSKKAYFMTPHWYKLISLNSEWRKKRPELSLFLTITDKMPKEELLNFKPVAPNEHREIQLPTKESGEPSLDTTELLKSQMGLHIELLQDEGLLQVGNTEMDNDVFIVKLMFRLARNLEQIINPDEKMNPLFRFHYNLLGTPADCGLTPKGDGIYSIQEKIAINFRTSLKALKEYFDKIFFIPVDLYYNETIIGHTLFKFTNLIHTTNLTEFLNSYPSDADNTMKIESSFLVEPLFDLPPSIPQPYVDYVFSLKYVSTTKVGNCEIIFEDKPQKVEYIEKICLIEPPDLDLSLLATNDENFEFQNEKINSVRSNSKHFRSEITVAEKLENLPNELKNNTDTDDMNDKLNMDTFLIEKYREPMVNVPRTFSFNLILKNLKFQRRPEIGIWQISLQHYKADTAYTIANIELEEVFNNCIELQNFELQLFFSSTPDEILDLIASDSCVLKINGPRGFHAVAELDNDVLLASTKEKRTGILLMENQSSEKVAMAHIFVYLEDLGISFNSQLKKFPRKEENTTYMDENLAYKIVEELEEWKQKQQEEFLVELKRKEIQHLALLSAEWQKKKMEQETKLGEKLEECSRLSEILDQAHKEVQQKGLADLEQKHLWEQAKLEAERNFEKTLISLNEKSRRIQDDMEHQLKLENLRYKELDMEKKLIEQELERIKKNTHSLQQQYDDMRKTYLPKEQLAGLFQDVRILSERLDETQKSKQFYKEQWAKIIREVHKMKAENLEKIETRLKQCKTMGLEEFINSEENDLIKQKYELNELKACFSSEDEANDICDMHSL